MFVEMTMCLWLVVSHAHVIALAAFRLFRRASQLVHNDMLLNFHRGWKRFFRFRVAEVVDGIRERAFA